MRRNCRSCGREDERGGAGSQLSCRQLQSCAYCGLGKGQQEGIFAAPQLPAALCLRQEGEEAELVDTVVGFGLAVLLEACERVSVGNYSDGPGHFGGV